MSDARRWQILAACMLVFLALGWVLTRPHHVPPRPSFARFPWELDGYTSRYVPVSNEALRQLDLTDYLSRNYRRETDGLVINLYVGYHGEQRQGSVIHSPSHCLPANGWFIVDRQRVPLPGDPGGALVNRMVVSNGEAEQLVYYWYQGRGRIEDDEFQAVLYRSADVALRNRSDEALVRFTTRGGDPAAERALVEFMKRVVSLLGPYLPA